MRQNHREYAQIAYIMAIQGHLVFILVVKTPPKMLCFACRDILPVTVNRASLVVPHFVILAAPPALPSAAEEGEEAVGDAEGNLAPSLTM